MLKILFIIIAITILIFLYLEKYNLTNKEFFLYKKNILFSRCNDYALGEIMKDVFVKYNIAKDSCNSFKESCNKWDIYLPCGYNNVENELNKLNVSHNNQVIFGINGCDSIVSKNNIWHLLNSKYGRIKASTLMPNTYIIENDSDMNLFRKQFNKNKKYILKKNIQRQQGLKITNNINNIYNLIKDKEYRIIQEMLVKPYCINGRKINIRVYMLVVCHNNQTKCYIYNDGFLYYTYNKYNPDSIEDKDNITSGYVPRHVYKENPLTTQDFYKYLNKKGQNSKLLENNIDILFTNLMNAINTSLCNLSKIKSNLTFQLFGADIAPDENLNVHLIEINKGPDMSAKDERDRQLKFNVVEDIFEKIGVISNNKTNNFKNIWSN